MNQRIFDERGAACYLGGDASSLRPRVLADWRFQQRGPRFFRIGRAIRYAQHDLDEFLQAQAVAPRHPHHRGRPPSRLKKVSSEQRAAITKRYATGRVTMRVLAAEYHVSISLISRIVRDVVIDAAASRRRGPPHKARDRDQQARAPPPRAERDDPGAAPVTTTPTAG
jgi:hypothetical protein